MDNKLTALIIIGLAGLGIYLESQDKLSELFRIIVAPNDSKFKFARTAEALVVLLIVLSVVTPKHAIGILFIFAFIAVYLDYLDNGPKSVLGGFLSTEATPVGGSTNKP